MIREATPDLLGEPFRFESIVEAPAPEGGDGVWHQYVIVQGTNRIIGLRAGTRAEVSLHVEDVIAHLNERFRKGKSGAASGYGRAKPSVGGAGASPQPVSETAGEDVVP